MATLGNRFVLRALARRSAATCVAFFAVAAAMVGASASNASAATTATPVPVIIDTDLYSSVDDVGALAVVFGLQQKGEARVIAITVDTRTERIAVAPNSWKCAAAIAQFYNAGSVPVGTDMPNNNTWNIPDPNFIAPCAARASASTPAPDSAVNTYRRALKAEADGSVVIISTGYLENLAALLDSPADAISPLTGRQLVTAKVKELHIMGGGYPSRVKENNLFGDPAAAQNVAANWPTKVVWAGYEVGDAVHTGQTISSKHPTTSPVRISYEAFIPPGNWYYSYDLVSVYHAIRPSDPLLTESAAGKNAVDGNGGNIFTTGSGNQFYLLAPNPDAVAAAIEEVLGQQPVVPAGPSLSATPATVSPGGSVAAAWQGVASPTSADWVGLYKQGATDTTILKWVYSSSCTQTQGTAKASGSCTITMPSTAGNYEFRLFKNNSYTRLATSGAITVGGTPPTGPAVSASASTVAPGGTVTASWSGVASPAVKDWIGLFKPGTANTTAIKWYYTSSCTQTAGTAAKASGSCPVIMPTTAGTYEFRLFANNGYTKLATSGSVTVGGSPPASPAVTLSASTVAPGAKITASWSGIASPTVKDWLGLFKPGTANTTAIKWYFTSSCTQTASTTAKASGSCLVTMPTTKGTYEIRLFANNGYTKLATSATITVA